MGMPTCTLVVLLYGYAYMHICCAVATSRPHTHYTLGLEPYTLTCHPGSGGNATDFLAQITSYDYSAPISEAGGTGQPGIGGANKFEVQAKLLFS